MGPCRCTEDSDASQHGNGDGGNDVVINRLNARTMEPETIDSNEAWAATGGYTPLTDSTENSYMMVGGGINSSGHSNDDNSSDDENDGDHFQGIARPTFYVNSSAFSSSNEHFSEADNFEELAAIALSALDEEYQHTLSQHQQGNDDVDIIDNEGRNPDIDVGINSNINNMNNRTKYNNDDDNKNEHNEKEVERKTIAATFDRGREELRQIDKQEGDFPVRWEELEEVSFTRKDQKKLEHGQVVDTDAVRKAVETLSTKNKDAAFHRKFSVWQKRQQMTTQNHVLIPAASCKAFFKSKSTAKSRIATKNLTRSATLAEAVVRLSILSSFPMDDLLLIDIVGVDYVECENELTIRNTFGPFVRWLDNYSSSMQHQRNDARVHFRLIGRELTGINSPLGIVVNLLTSTSIRATATCHSGVYHEFLEQLDITSNDNDIFHGKVTSDLSLAFNAGIWGYEEWGTTIRYLAQQQGLTSMVITAYTFEECEGDKEVILQATALSDNASVGINVLAENGDTEKKQKPLTSDHEGSNKTDSISCRAEILWEPEKNPFRSEVIRETKFSYQKNRENACWQAWLLGGKKSATESK